MMSGPTTPLEMQVQNKVAELIAAKNTIYELMQSTNAEISAQAAVMMKTQDALQAQLAVLVPKTNNPSLTDAPELLAFYYQMITHIDNVKKLKEASIGIPIKETSNWKMLLAGAFLIGAIITRRR